MKVARAVPDWRRALWLLIAATFFLQSYVTQTHIHFVSVSDTSSAFASLEDSVIKVATGGDHGKQSTSDDPAKCPLCQAVGHAGQYVWPAALVLVIAIQTAQAVPLAPVLSAGLISPSHNWQGRAPPSL